jgi:hypothetical protein
MLVDYCIVLEQVADFKSESAADIISEPVAELRRNQQATWVKGRLTIGWGCAAGAESGQRFQPPTQRNTSEDAWLTLTEVIC